MTHLHFDVYLPNDLDPADQLGVKIVDLGADGSFNAPNPEIAYTISNESLDSKKWLSIDIDISGFTPRTNLAQIIFEDLGSPLEEFYVDNIYFYK